MERLMGLGTEVIVIEERLRLDRRPVRRLEVLDMQCIGVRAQHLIAAQYRRKSPTTSMPLNFGSMMVFSTAELTERGSPRTKASP